MESIFLIMSGVILAAGILYWFWSHIQLTQKKVQLLENAVFELRGMLTNRAPPAASAPSSAPAPAAAPPSVYNDLADDGWEEDESKEVEAVSTPLESFGGDDIEIVREDAVPDDLRPGGRIVVPTEAEQVAEESSAGEQFRELFVGREEPATAAAAGPRTPESLESMPVKELRRLAEQRGIAGAAEMRKKEILSALRQQIAPATVERTLDLAEIVKEDADDVPAAD
jgi:hypothetical protein